MGEGLKGRIDEERGAGRFGWGIWYGYDTLAWLYRSEPGVGSLAAWEIMDDESSYP